MTNAKIELQNILNTVPEITCALIYKYEYAYHTEDNQKRTYSLMVNHTDAALEEFYDSLDFEYDGSYGGQELYGIVWLEDGSWLSRYVYDGSEWWRRNCLPVIPDELFGE